MDEISILTKSKKSGLVSGIISIVCGLIAIATVGLLLYIFYQKIHINKFPMVVIMFVFSITGLLSGLICGIKIIRNKRWLFLPLSLIGLGLNVIPWLMLVIEPFVRSKNS